MVIGDKKLIDLDGLAHYNDKVNEELATKQDNLVSGDNIKTINGVSILGSGDVDLPSITDEEIGNLFEEDILENRFVPQDEIQSLINSEY